METSVKRLVSIPQARHLLGDIGHTTVYELIKRGEIVKVNIDRRGFITSESLEAYMDRLSGHTEADRAEHTNDKNSAGDVSGGSLTWITQQEVAADPLGSGIDGEVK